MWGFTENFPISNLFVALLKLITPSLTTQSFFKQQQHVLQLHANSGLVATAELQLATEDKDPEEAPELPLAVIEPPPPVVPDPRVSPIRLGK